MKLTLRSRVAAEFLGTAFLLAAVVGSGIVGERDAASFCFRWIVPSHVRGIDKSSA
jgi:glycerol uptake facilitator-like aquaporin